MRTATIRNLAEAHRLCERISTACRTIQRELRDSERLREAARRLREQARMTARGPGCMTDSRPSAECIVWRSGKRRCELWTIHGVGRLRLYHGDILIRQEAVQRGRCYEQAMALRDVPDVQSR